MNFKESERKTLLEFGSSFQIYECDRTKSIVCQLCRMESFHPEDIDKNHHGKCNIFHGDFNY